MVRQTHENQHYLRFDAKASAGADHAIERRLNVIGLTYAKGVLQGPALSRKQSDDSTGKPHTADRGRSALLAPAELSAFEVEPHAGATERAHSVHAVDPFGVRRGARLENEPRHRFPIT